MYVNFAILIKTFESNHHINGNHLHTHVSITCVQIKTSPPTPLILQTSTEQTSRCKQVFDAIVRRATCRKENAPMSTILRYERSNLHRIDKCVVLPPVCCACVVVCFIQIPLLFLYFQIPGTNAGALKH